MVKEHIHMLGICGTGMGSLAALLKEKGMNVTGSDENVYPPMSTQLENLGIKLFCGYRPDNLKDRPDLVVIGNVISRGNPEAEAVISASIPYLSMPQAVSKYFIAGRHSIVIAGTHGKTTTSTLCAWLLESAGLAPGFLIGGVGLNLNSSARIGRPPYFVVEGDEYDTAFFDKGPKFLHYRPNSVILGPVEFDHADIYRDLAHVMSSFERLVDIIPADGLLVACSDSENVRKLLSRARCGVVTYGIRPGADYRADAAGISENGVEFRLNVRSNPVEQTFRSFLYGEHNLQNTAGVMALLIELGIPVEKIAKGLESFKGVKRRQEIRGIVNGITVIDDFAHHPTAIRETIRAMKMRYPSSRLISVFEPRSNTSRRNVFQNELPGAFAGSDISIIANPFKQEKLAAPERLDVAWVIETMRRTGLQAYNFGTTDEIVDFVAKEAKFGDVVLIMSNGGFDNIHDRLLKRLK